MELRSFKKAPHIFGVGAELPTQAFVSRPDYKYWRIRKVYVRLVVIDSPRQNAQRCPAAGLAVRNEVTYLRVTLS